MKAIEVVYRLPNGHILRAQASPDEQYGFIEEVSFAPASVVVYAKAKITVDPNTGFMRGSLMEDSVTGMQKVEADSGSFSVTNTASSFSGANASRSYTYPTSAVVA